MIKMKKAILIVTLAAMIVWPGSAAAEEWSYPTPDPDLDVNDISFYEAANNQPLPVIKSDRPRRIIFCIGDGMGFNQVTLARHRAVGPGGRLHMETLPVSGIVRTYSANSVVTDSAAAATALACGIKTNNGMIGQDPEDRPCDSILMRLDQKGWRTGLAVTCSITHATPAGFSSHVKNRGMEVQIAEQLLSGGVDILLGGGRAFFISQNGLRKDGRDLLAEAVAAGVQTAYTADQLAGLEPGSVLGLFADKEMTTFSPEPSLPQMTRKAIELLDAGSGEWFAPDPRFFLMVEGSQIDWACHDNNADNTVRQLLLFDLAVKEALDFARRDKQTLVIVTADHETGGLTLTNDSNGKELKAKWSTKGHSGADVPLFAFGPGAQHFAGTLDNTAFFGVLSRLTGLDQAASETDSQTAPHQNFLKIRR